MDDKLEEMVADLVLEKEKEGEEVVHEIVLHFLLSRLTIDDLEWIDGVKKSSEPQKKILYEFAGQVEEIARQVHTHWTTRLPFSTVRRIANVVYARGFEQKINEIKAGYAQQMGSEVYIV